MKTGIKNYVAELQQEQDEEDEQVETAEVVKSLSAACSPTRQVSSASTPQTAVEPPRASSSILGAALPLPRRKRPLDPVTQSTGDASVSPSPEKRIKQEIALSE